MMMMITIIILIFKPLFMVLLSWPIHNHFTALWILSWTTQVSHYQKNIHPLTPITAINHTLSASSIYYDPCILSVQYSCLTVFFHISLQVFFGLPLGLAPSTSYPIIVFFLQHIPIPSQPVLL